MVDYVLPAGVRVADADRVRLARTWPPEPPSYGVSSASTQARWAMSMVEAGSRPVVVDDGSDIGGGASIMGTLSGGGRGDLSWAKPLHCWGQPRSWASDSATAAWSGRACTQTAAAQGRHRFERPDHHVYRESVGVEQPAVSRTA